MMDEILERSLKFSKRYGHMTLGEVMLELEKDYMLKSGLHELLKEMREAERTEMSPATARAIGAWANELEKRIGGR